MKKVPVKEELEYFTLTQMQKEQTLTGDNRNRTQAFIRNPNLLKDDILVSYSIDYIQCYK